MYAYLTHNTHISTTPAQPTLRLLGSQMNPVDDIYFNFYLVDKADPGPHPQTNIYTRIASLLGLVLTIIAISWWVVSGSLRRSLVMGFL